MRCSATIADPLRQRIVELLAGEQLCTCHLVEELAGDPDQLVQPPPRAREAGLVVSEQAGRYTYHRLVPERLEQLSAGLPTVSPFAAGRRGEAAVG